MCVRLGLLLLVFVLQSSFTGKSSLTLRERYGQPISETYLVRPGITVSASYGKSGDVCELLISPQKASSLIKSANEPPATIDFYKMTEIIDELVPVTERGKGIGTGMLNLRCLPADDCAGSMGHWEKLLLYRNAGRGGEHYAAIQWQRDECTSTTGRR
jgi:hypothetical protein